VSRPAISDLRLERLAAGDLPAAREAALRAELADDAEARDRLAAIERSNRELLERFPPHSVYEEVVRRLGATPDELSPPQALRILRSPPAWAAAAACLAVAVLVLLPGGEERPGSRAKGARPALVVHRVLEGATEQLATGDAARAGDRLQISVLRAAGHHVVIVSIDGAGQVTRHFPFDAGEAAPVDRSPFSLPRSYELDDAPGFERFVLVSSPVPVYAETVLESARHLAARGAAARAEPLADLPPEAEQTSFLLEKVR